jgi:hypothetical protein
MGQRDIRRLLIVGAMARVRWAVRNGAHDGSWLARMLERKPRMPVAIAPARVVPLLVVWEAAHGASGVAQRAGCDVGRPPPVSVEVRGC